MLVGRVMDRFRVRFRVRVWVRMLNIFLKLRYLNTNGHGGPLCDRVSYDIFKGLLEMH